MSKELFTSLFVLESDFRFQPVPGLRYWLYWSGGKFALSLLSPTEKITEATPVGECFLHQDMTWTLEMSENARENHKLQQLLEKRQQAFAEQLARKGGLDELLPHYHESIPFTQRVLLFALGHSLRTSLERSGESETFLLSSGPRPA